MLVGALLTAAACSGDARFDRAETEALARTELNRVLPATVTAVDCERSPRRSSGDRERCVAVLSSGDRVDVELVSAGGGELEVSLLDAVMEPDELAERITAGLRDQLERSVEVDCGPEELIVAEVGDVLTCEARGIVEAGEDDESRSGGQIPVDDEATDGDAVREIEVRITNAAGNVEIRSIDPAED